MHLPGTQPLPLFNMGPKEAAAYVKKLDGVLRSYASDFDLGIDKDNALAAFETVIALLLEFRGHYPAERATIDEVLRRHGYSIVEN